MKKILLLIALCLSVSVSAFAQYDGEEDEYSAFGEEQDPDPQTDFLGFMLLPGSNTLERFYEVHKNYDGTFKYTQLTMDGFVNRAAGRERSVANPDGRNMFNNFGIKNPGIVGDLWRLRYKEDPYDSMGGETKLGWANNSKSDCLPSPEQFEILKQFGIETVQSLCYGDEAFMLLHCMEQADWIARYKGAASSDAPVATGSTNSEGESFIDN